jgi:hypothetical protein
MVADPAAYRSSTEKSMHLLCVTKKSAPTIKAAHNALAIKREYAKDDKVIVAHQDKMLYNSYGFSIAEGKKAKIA